MQILTSPHPHRTLLLISLSLLICACSSTPTRTTSPLNAAPQAQPPLVLAEQAIRAGNEADAQGWLQQIEPAALSPDERLRYEVLQAELHLLRGSPTEALRLMPAPWQTANPQLAVWVEQARARVLFGLDDPVRAVQVLVEAERLLTSRDARTAHHEQIWAGLADAHLDLGIYGRLAEVDAVTRGWVELAIISRSVWLESAARDSSLSDWRQRFPGHPGHDWLARINEQRRSALAEFGSVALLLPLQGAIASAAESVRDGFLAALYGEREHRPTVRVYDSGDTPESLLSAYQRALDDGAEFVVGPLRKESVSQMAIQGQPAVPILALNYLDDFEQAPFNFFQWGLAPEDEARQAAERAIADHHRHAIVLVPNNDWGDRVAQAFGIRLQELGGQVLEVARYDNNTSDYSGEIESLLNLDASAARHATMRAMLGERPEFEPRPRADVDMIFIAARSQQARSIRPQLTFHRAGKLPIYATALIYDGKTETGRELDGIHFCDMPWMLQDDGNWAPVKRQIAHLFDDRNRAFPRLFVLGYDAYNLVRLIRSGQLQTGLYLPAASGNLSLNEAGKISRSLTCATLKDGKPEIQQLDLFPSDFESLDATDEDQPRQTPVSSDYEWPRG